MVKRMRPEANHDHSVKRLKLIGAVPPPSDMVSPAHDMTTKSHSFFFWRDCKYDVFSNRTTTLFYLAKNCVLISSCNRQSTY